MDQAEYNENVTDFSYFRIASPKSKEPKVSAKLQIGVPSATDGSPVVLME